MTPYYLYQPLTVLSCKEIRNIEVANRRRPGVGCTITCTLCGVLAQYQGESGRNMFARGKDHLREFRGLDTTNCMVIHNNTHHNGSREITYKMEPTGVFNPALDRELDESILVVSGGESQYLGLPLDPGCHHYWRLH